MTKTLLDVIALKKNYQPGPWWSTLLNSKSSLAAVDNVSFTLYDGEILGLVGESGSGKTTIGKSIIQLTPLTSGKVLFKHQRIDHLSRSKFRQFRKHIQMIFQDLDAALNPAMRVKQIMSDVISSHYSQSKQQCEQKISDLLQQVNLSNEILHRYPDQLSGGQKRRIAIANVLAVNPKIIIADEPTTGLDNYTQQKILDLLKTMQATRMMSLLLITHDLNLVRQICQRVLVLYQGKLVEQANVEQLNTQAAHPYTDVLWQSDLSVPMSEPNRSLPANLTSAVDENHRPILGCCFAPRCPQYIAKGRPSVCVSGREQPQLTTVSSEHRVACYFPLTNN